MLFIPFSKTNLIFMYISLLFPTQSPFPSISCISLLFMQIDWGAQKNKRIMYEIRLPWLFLSGVMTGNRQFFFAKSVISHHFRVNASKEIKRQKTSPKLIEVDARLVHNTSPECSLGYEGRYLVSSSIRLAVDMSCEKGCAISRYPSAKDESWLPDSIQGSILHFGSPSTKMESVPKHTTCIGDTCPDCPQLRTWIISVKKCTSTQVQKVVDTLVEHVTGMHMATGII